MLINTNARSLCPKIDSLVDCITETDTQIAVVSETWLQSGTQLNHKIEDLALGSGLGMTCRNRDAAGHWDRLRRNCGFLEAERSQEC